MKNRIILSICSLFFCGLFFSSCEYETIVPLEPELPDEISFSQHIIPIFDNSCNTVGCHVQNHFAVDLTPENAFDDIWAKNLVNINDPDNSPMHETLTGGGSHEGRSTPNQHAHIHKWIEQGAKNN